MPSGNGPETVAQFWKQLGAAHSMQCSFQNEEGQFLGVQGGLVCENQRCWLACPQFAFVFVEFKNDRVLADRDFW
jgi:hypothetical protein